jgi:hypothetical protein
MVAMLIDMGLSNWTGNPQGLGHLSRNLPNESQRCCSSPHKRQGRKESLVDLLRLPLLLMARSGELLAGRPLQGP